jgi:prepilin-type processing-associated H-X9-DG protein
VYEYQGTYPVFSDGTWIDGGRASLPVNFSTGTSWSMARHGKGVNMAFPDGSVRLVTMGQLYSAILLHPGDVINPSWIQQVPAEYQ